MGNKKIRIGNRLIGEGEPVFITAEMGVNHNGNLARARKMVREAVKAGVDAVKFQTFRAEDFLNPGKGKYSYKCHGRQVRESMFNMFKRLELPRDWHKILFSDARKQKRIPFSTPMDNTAVDFLTYLGAQVFKVGADDLTNYPLLRYIAGKKRPVILSTGMSTIAEIDKAVYTITKTGNNNIILLHCVSLYPARNSEVNLKAMDYLRKRFGFPVGFSDHTQGIIASVAAVARGASVIEKHFTLDKGLPGPDHYFSADPEELKMLVSSVREVEKCLGRGIKRPTAGEEKMRRLCRRSIVAASFISRGTLITRDMISLKRPGTGLSPDYIGKIVGRRALVNIKKGKLITLKDTR